VKAFGIRYPEILCGASWTRLRSESRRFFGAVEIEMVRPVTRVRRCKPDDHSCELSTITDLMHYLDTIFKSRNLAEGGAIWL
jgi:hypothetical protein